MAKQQPFPHPPLEVGVAKYPTPLVPNYYDKTGGWGLTDQGHIILLEKVSIEKGTFTPQPLDGSVTYTGRDANKWPDTLYLVSESPTDDGQFIYRYWANARSYSSQNPWNYGISYSLQDPAYPTYTRTYIVRRADFNAFAIGDRDPLNNNAYMLAQEMQELPEDNPLRSQFVSVKVIYEVPGSHKEGDGNKPGLMGTTQDVDTVVLPGTTPDALSIAPIPPFHTVPDNGFPSVLQSVVEAKSATQSTKKTTITTGPYELDSHEYDDFFQGNVLIKRMIVPYGSPLTHYDGLLSYKDEPIDLTKCQRTIVESPSLGLPPTLTEYHTATYTSPTLVFGVDVQYVDVSCDGTGDLRMKVVPNTRAAQTQTTIFKTVTSYSFGEPLNGDTEMFNPVLKYIEFNGFAVSFNLGSGLCDQIQSSGSGVPVHYCSTGPNVFETWDIPATNISASSYLDLVGTYQKISWACKYWKANIWQSKTLYVKLI